MLIDEIGIRKNMYKPWHKVFVPVWAFFMVLVLVFSFHIKKVGQERRLHVVTFLESVGDCAVVYVNGQSLDSCGEAVAKLLTLRKRKPHGSVPVEKFEIMVTAGEKQLKLVLGTDSEVDTEYWVYLVDEFKAGKGFPSDNDIIGRIDRNENDDVFLEYTRGVRPSKAQKAQGQV